MIILNDEQARILLDSINGEKIDKKKVEELDIANVLKGYDIQNRMDYRAENVREDVLSVLGSDYYNEYKEQQPKELIDKAIDMTVESIINRYDHSDYNETIDYLLSDTIHRLIIKEIQV